MNTKRDWQEQGLRIGGQLFDSKDACLLVTELQCRINDPQIRGEIDDFLTKNQPLTEPTRHALFLIATGLMMGRPLQR